MLVRSEDRYAHFHSVPPPHADLSGDAMDWHRRILSAQNEALYEGAATTTKWFRIAAVRRPA